MRLIGGEVGYMELILKGKVWKYGDHIDTDVIYPGKYTYTLREPEEIAAHALEDLDPEFSRSAAPGDIIVAGRNWGMGSSREQAVTCLVYRGVAAVVARSFSRIYYRNGINQGLPLLTCPQAVEAARPGSMLAMDLAHGIITIDGQLFEFPPLSENALRILEAGGLVPYLQRKLSLPVAPGKRWTG
jgi:3-isopropylmalate/(R)-2-methylmalate dehydratase small subunit